MPRITFQHQISPLKHSISSSPIRRLMEQQGASIVACNAVDLLIDHIEMTATALTEKAKAFTLHTRKKVTKKDLLLAIKNK